MFVTVNDFNNPPYMIPNPQGSPGGVTNTKEILADLEKKILIDLMGYEMYLQFIEGLQTSGSPEQRWLDLKNGVAYRTCVDGPRYEWVGMKEMLIPAVFSKFVPLLYRRMHNNGVVINNGQQNTEMVAPIYEVVTAWNDFVRIAGGSCELNNTLAGFLRANESSYPDFVFCSPQRQNQLNL